MLKFDFFYSLPFWAGVILIALAFRILGRKANLRKWLLAAASTLMLLSIPRMTPAGLAAIVGLTLIVYLIGLNLNGGAADVSRSRRLFLAVSGVILVLLFLGFFKYRFFQGLLTNSPVFLIGVSYFCFKMIHFLVESFRRKIEGLDLLTFLDYILFFVPFISGPINRYNPFSVQVGRPARAGAVADWKAGLERIIHGLFKKFVLAQIMFPYILGAQGHPLTELNALGLLLGLYAYAFYFYFDFSGYSDLAIGAARLFGLELPENFNNPFLKKNIRELWTNWHMSLTSWLVDYIYWPIVRKLRSGDYFRRHPVALSNLGMIVTFIACGMWHGEAAHFILWGAYHGLGISILTVYQREKRKIRNLKWQAYFYSKYSQAAGNLLTFNFFSFGLALFVLDLKDLMAIANRLF